MKLSNLVLRVLVFLAGVPILFAAVLLFPEPHFPVFTALVFAVAIIGGYESAALFGVRKKRYRGDRITVPLLSCSIPLATLAQVTGLIDTGPVGLAGIVIVSFLLAAQVFRRNEPGFARIIPSVTSHVMIMLYPGLFLSYAIRMTTLPHAGILILVFLCAVFFNDTCAYIFGRLFGRNSGGVVPISPNKSMAGFVGGLIMSPVVVLLANTFFPELFPGPIRALILFGTVIGLATIVGDLVESGLKRSATVKDSGNVIPGRGGILDSVDSPIFVAPVFYYLYVALFLI